MAGWWVVALLGIISLIGGGTGLEGFAGKAWAEEGEWSGKVAAELRIFPEQAITDQQKNLYPSLAIQPEYYQSWDEGNQSFTMVPFLRLDPYDSERNHADIRELTWLKSAEQWELRVGIRKLFWGVTESQHLVNMINQTDAVEDLDGDEKLGQPMVNASIFGELGTFDLFVLPYFRERTFASWQGRPHAPFAVDEAQTRYESAAGKHHVDWAARWAHSIETWDIGVSHFSGTGREPLLQLGNRANGEVVLIPYYVQIQQSGLDIQTTNDGWLLKAELISREQLGERYFAATGGFEYTVVGVYESDADLGIIAEYLFDDRGKNATTPFADDLMLGLRLTMNDAQSTDFLLGSIVDPDSGAMAWKLEGSRRLEENWKISVEGRTYFAIPSEDRLYAWRRDSLLRVELARYF